MTSHSSAVDQQATVPTRAVVKVSFAVLVALVVVGGVGLKVYEYRRYLSFATEAVMDPLPLFGPAPELQLAGGPGQPDVALAGLRGRPVLVHFWATWCPPCRDELRTLEYLARRLGDRLEIIAVTVDDDWSEVARFFGAQPPSFRLAWDQGRSTASRYGTEKFPETFLIDGAGRLVAKFVGARDWNSAAALRYLDGALDN